VINLKEIGCGGVNWMQDIVQWRALADKVMNIYVPQKVEHFF
jgi:hypothetical protein